METLATTSQLLHANADLPGEARQCMVKLDFVSPVPRMFVHEFMRIRFTGQMMLGGEGAQAEGRICSKCSGPWVSRVSADAITCFNPRCEWKGQRQNIAKPRGVCRVLIPQDFITNVDGRELCSSVILELDRRYREEVLAAVYRTAGMICDQLGWKLK